MCSFGETLFIKDTKYFIAWGFPDGALEKNLPANMQEVQEWRLDHLGWEDPLENKMAIHSSILAQKIPQTKGPGGLQFTGS